ncbi:RagB/SusD family nutrient uptake outer membrane protein [Tamlana sp. 2201CG12-4]|uniref:RagB/SusD family nutrient uptake outer membrane protein n=1 Tax=Tamlana sp. 2201CG12-4 TaxID=3112582 RepID=UPI002DB6BB83|nr:RagB/SusD family nutrient uptake outer membrane protein [Tamlana sp. 2201CG12-4]MEC3907210.1 RagB/SusD family nutrient uptake outer membrane protein [Tamlana sp. 2201CG12-4]
MRKLTILLVTTIILTGCSDWLELEPENELVKDDFWQTQSDVEGILISCYRELQQSTYNLVLYGELRSDQMEIKSIDGNARSIREGNISSNNTYARWGFFYSIINYASSVIENAPDVADIDKNFTEAELRSVIAEARFLRSLSYFYLVRIWKEAPIIEKSYETDDTPLTVAKSSEDELIALIIDDLLEAIPNLKSQYEEEWEKWGRATKVAGESLLADVYLWAERYEDCIEYCDKVIANPNKVLLATENWFSIFSEGNTNEGIFEIQFNQEYNQTGPWNVLYYNNVSPDFKFPAELIEEEFFAEEDIRGFEATYAKTERRILKFITATPKKPVFYSGNEFVSNFIIYRLADIYLMKAEAHAVLGQYDLSDQAIMTVRERAGLADQLISIPNSRDAYEDFILTERQKEFTAEGKAWFDLLRVGKRNNFERKKLVIDKLLLEVTGVDRPTIERALQDPYAYYMPIHQSELTQNSELVQNPYYQF